MRTLPNRILTNRFVLRPLIVADVSDRYARWLSDQVTSQYIISAASILDLADLRRYVMKRSGREDVLFLGIFDKKSGLHIGNIKYEPVDSELGYAIMGILIGEPAWRGKGVAAEALCASAQWLRQHRNIKQIVLGVSRANTAAIQAYKKLGFVEESTEFVPLVSEENKSMVWHLSSPDR